MSHGLQSNDPLSGNELFDLAQACAECRPDDDQHNLLTCLHTAVEGFDWQPVLIRRGWYRLGGIIDEQGRRVSEDVSAWVLSEAGEDLLDFYHRYASKHYRVTRLKGKTHYLVAQTGNRPQDFVQLEIEEIEEVVDRYLLGEDIPDLPEEISDPLDYQPLEPVHVSTPRYLFRRLIRVADYFAGYVEDMDIAPPILRFMNDWTASSASEAGHFCEHWVLALREYVDGYGEPRFIAKPITTYQSEIPAIGEDVPRRSRLANLIHGFDRQVGYPMAWYFFMLSHKQVSHLIAESIHQDLVGAYDYLPARDVKVLQQWYDRAYGV